MALGNIVYTPKIPLTRADVVDNLESTAANLPLSARMGGRIARKIGDSTIKPTYVHDENLKDFALRCSDNGMFSFFTDATTGGLPPYHYHYSNGLIFRRAGGTTNILLFSYDTSEMVVATCLNGVWSDWRKVSTEAI